MKFVPNHTSIKEGAFNIKGDLLSEALSAPTSQAGGSGAVGANGELGLVNGVPAPSDPSDGQPTLLRGRYRFKTELGRGAFGTTYVAEDTDLLDSKVVIKRLHNLDHKAIDLMKEEVSTRKEAQLSHILETDFCTRHTAAAFFNALTPLPINAIFAPGSDVARA